MGRIVGWVIRMIRRHWGRRLGHVIVLRIDVLGLWRIVLMLLLFYKAHFRPLSWVPFWWIRVVFVVVLVGVLEDLFKHIPCWSGSCEIPMNFCRVIAPNTITQDKEHTLDEQHHSIVMVDHEMTIALVLSFVLIETVFGFRLHIVLAALQWMGVSLTRIVSTISSPCTLCNYACLVWIRNKVRGKYLQWIKFAVQHACNDIRGHISL